MVLRRYDLVNDSGRYHARSTFFPPLHSGILRPSAIAWGSCSHQRLIEAFFRWARSWHHLAKGPHVAIFCYGIIRNLVQFRWNFGLTSFYAAYAILAHSELPFSSRCCEDLRLFLRTVYQLFQSHEVFVDYGNKWELYLSIWVCSTDIPVFRRKAYR